MSRVLNRAVDDADKEVRRQAILDAAESLFLQQPDRMANVAEVAQAAGLAKGTVYLYFPSKEEMFLALHERQVEAFFDELSALLEGSARLGFDDVFDVALRRIIREPGYLDLTGRCLGLMDREITIERALEHKVRVGQMLERAGAGLERHFPQLSPGDGVAVLCNSYGLMVGMWQLLHPNARFGDAMARPEMCMFRRDYESEVEKALRALWSGMLAANAAARAPARRKSR